MAEKKVVLLDACVLYPAPLRDLLMQLMSDGLYQGKWSATIHEEWMAAVLEQRPDLNRGQLERTRDLMNQVGIDSLVSGYEGTARRIKGLPDPDDAHVVAAAIKGKAGAILTFNTRDFPTRVLQPLGLEVMTPDAFLSSLMEENSALVCAAMRKIRARLKHPPLTSEEYLNTLAQQKLTRTVEKVQSSREVI